MKIEMVNGEYSELEKTYLGTTIAEMFHMKKDPTNKARYLTAWGNKTPVGIYEMIRRLGVAIHEGNIQYISYFKDKQD